MTDVNPGTNGVGAVAGAAAAAEHAIEGVMKVEPMVAGIAGMFIPQVALVQPWILMVAPYLERALDDVSKSKNNDALMGIIALIQHISKGQPNSPVLGPLQDASAQGSGIMQPQSEKPPQP